MTLSAAMKLVHASIITIEINAQKIIPSEKNGKNSCIGDLKIIPNTIPIVAIITPILMVSQNGPKADLL